MVQTDMTIYNNHGITVTTQDSDVHITVEGKHVLTLTEDESADIGKVLANLPPTD